MPSHFRYKRGKTEIESLGNNKDAYKLAREHNRLTWVFIFLIAGAVLCKVLTTDNFGIALSAVIQLLKLTAEFY